MPSQLKITPEWEYLGGAPPEESACFAALSIEVNGQCLTEGHDALANRLRKAPYLSAYHLAEWLAWNWWRLRWEPRTAASDWGLTHCIGSIGGGYIWPDITLSSDGERVAVSAHAAPERASTPFRYINSALTVISAAALESGIDDFLHQVLERLAAENVKDTNVHHLWADVQAERADADLAFGRKLEALLGCEPDEVNPDVLARLLADANALGRHAAEEVAAGARSASSGALEEAVPSLADIQDMAARKGRQSAVRDRVRWTSSPPDAARAHTPAWRLGVDAARALRQQEQLRAQDPVSNATLAQLMGTDAQLLQPAAGEKPLFFAFALDESERQGRIVLRSRWEVGRRFELARLLGEQLMPQGQNRLLPATAAKTYQQQLQRAFAAELLCPFAQALEILSGDYSEEKQMAVAEHFDVSEMTVQTQLLNHGMLTQSTVEDELAALVA